MLAASVQPRAGARLAGKPPPEHSILQPPAPGLPSRRGEVSCPFLLVSFTFCAGPHSIPSGLSCCCGCPGSTARGPPEVARAWSGCGEPSWSQQALRLRNPGDLPRAYHSRAEDHTAQGWISPTPRH